MIRLTIWCWLLSTVVGLGVFAQQNGGELTVLSIETLGIETSLPQGWTVIADTGSYEVHSPNKDILLSFLYFPEFELEAVLTGLDEMMKTSISNLITVGEPSMTEVNNLPVMMAEAKGTMDGINVQIGTFIISRSTHVLLILGIAREGAPQKEIEGLDIIIGELHAINP